MIVEEIMTPDPVTVSVTASVRDVFDILHDMDVRHVPVVEGDVLVGMVSDRDLRSYEAPILMTVDNPESVRAELRGPVTAIMRGDVVAVSPEDNVGEVVRLMIDHRYGAVPVVDDIDGRLIGIVSYIDVLRATEEFF